MRTHHGIWPGAGKQCLPALGSRNLGHLSPIHQTIYHVSLGLWESWGSAAPSSNCSFLRGLGTGNAATTLATRVFFWRVCKYAVLFLTTMTAFLPPCLNLVYVFCTVRPCSKEPSSVHKACTMMLICSPVWTLPALTSTT